MAILASVTQVFSGETSGTDDLAVTSVSTTLSKTATSTDSTVMWSYTSASPETTLKNFDLTALTGDDRGTVTFTEVYGILLRVRAGSADTVDPSSGTSNLYSQQHTLQGGPATIGEDCFVVQASSESLGAVTASNKVLEYDLTAAEIDLAIWGIGTIA